MKKIILIICVIMIGSILGLTSNSFASREMRGHHHGRGGHYQKWHKPAFNKYGRAWHKHNRWHRRPVYRHGHPGRYYRYPRRIVVQEVNNYYDSAESYAYPEDEFNASASVSDSGFSFSVGVRRTD